MRPKIEKTLHQLVQPARLPLQSLVVCVSPLLARNTPVGQDLGNLPHRSERRVRNSCDTAETKSDWRRATASSRIAARAINHVPAPTSSASIPRPANHKRRRPLKPSRFA